MMRSEFPLLTFCPLDKASPRVLVAAQRAGAYGVLTLSSDPTETQVALSRVVQHAPKPFGARIPWGVSVDPASLPAEVETVVVPAGVDLAPWRPRRVWVSVTSLDEALAAANAGADGLIAKGCEAGGRVGESSSFVLLQQLLSAVELPTWVHGGVGLHTAAACIAGGAQGVVLDTQLALTRESELSEPIQDAIRRMDGSETRVVQGHRVFHRPDLASAQLQPDSWQTLQSMLSAGGDLDQSLIPMGQDAAFAASLAERFHTVGGVITAVLESIDRHLELAASAEPLAPNGPLATTLGTTFPIAQGPMTRVSDTPDFADAVAREGGLPFLALSMLRAEQVRGLVDATKQRLGDRPWGVGILGFVPPALREEQLAVLREIKPSFALIAGGRPSQARPLDAQGTRTYLHVPSPGLLDLYLKDDARRFVFEGRECGGHVGPRSSFVLWEAQIERLLAWGELSEIEIFFAGGIHDARSAAMVAAMAAPLVERGVQIGVLMGTSYLFTREAVETGAITAAYQGAAVSCEETVLLETAPGHATRCVRTPYVEVFEQQKEQLKNDGHDAKEVWAALEQLNLGRLRIASKGLKRVDGELVEAGAAEQSHEGLYMIGQVATMRDQVCSIGDLHRGVSAGATDWLAKIASDAPASVMENKPADVAIVGVACAFPGATDAQTFWSNIVMGSNEIREVPPERWNTEIYYDENSQDGRRTPSKWGGFLQDVAFDPLEYGIPPRSLAAIEPVQLLSLEIANRALRDAGYASRQFNRSRTSVIFGAEAGTELAGGYGFRNMYPQLLGTLPQELDAHLPTLTEDSFPGVLANVIAGRIANRLDLGGSNYTVDAACASSLAALDVAVKELSSGTSDMVLCGGADLHNSINDYLMFSSVHALSSTGQCRSFDSSADGIVLGEGVAVVVLKRLADAQRDGDRIYAVVKGLGSSSDGRSLGLTAPRQSGQVRALQRAYKHAGVCPTEVGMVEAHGTGTVVGDRTELSSLSEVFSEVSPGRITLGSVKSQIGHTKCAAGMAGLIKAAFALHHRILPPTVNIEQPNAFWDPVTSPFVFHDTAKPWMGADRHAAVSAFGFGGTNFHAVLSEYSAMDEPEAGHSVWPSELFLFRGPDREDARRQIEQLATLLDSGFAGSLRDLAYTVSTASQEKVQIAIVARDRVDLCDKLRRAKRFENDPSGIVVDDGVRGDLAYLFPGQGSQRPGMLSDLFVAFPALREYLAHGGQWLDTWFPGAAFLPADKVAQRAAITDTRVAQATLGIAGLAVADLLDQFGVAPQGMGGHSYGELIALAAAGALDAEQLISLSAARGQCILDAAGDDPGAMAAVSAPIDRVREFLSSTEGVVVANHNAPDQVVISGPTEDIERVVELLSAQGLRARQIPVACAFHSPIVAGASETFHSRLKTVDVQTPKTTVWSNSTASPYQTTPEDIRQQLADHIRESVRFVEQIEAMYAGGTRVFIETGPGQVLSNLVGRILGDRPHCVLPCDRGRADVLTDVQRVLAELAVREFPLCVDPLYEGRCVQRLDFSAPRDPQRSATLWLVNGHTARPMHGKLPETAMKPISEPLRPQSAVVATEAASDGDRVMLEYLAGMRAIVDQQSEVMLRYLGQEVRVAAVQARPASRPLAVRAVTPPVEEEIVAAVASDTEAPVDLQEALLAIVSERTGYPERMLGLDMDLEADLSIDSIKRIEILGALGERIGLDSQDGGARDELVEQLATIKTLRGIIAWLEANATEQEDSTSSPVEPRNETEEVMAVPSDVSRYVLAVDEAMSCEISNERLVGKSFCVVQNDGEIAQHFVARLEAHGATVRVIQMNEDPGAPDGLVYLPSVKLDEEDPVKPLFGLIQTVLDRGTSLLVAATGLGGAFGRTMNGTGPLLRGGVSGLFKSVAKEYPAAFVRVVDLDTNEDPVVLAEQLLTEVQATDDRLEVGYHERIRRVLSVIEQPASRSTNGTTRTLEPEAVVLVTGGARGITARVAVALAKRFQCRLELVGRSPSPGKEVDPELAKAADLAELRRLLVQRGAGTPREIERTCRRLLAERQVRATLATIEASGASVTYHAVDVRDDVAFGGVIKGIYERHGRLDGVIHGAGVLEDKLLKHKSSASFSRVFDTKVAGAMTLAKGLRNDVGFVVFFSSVSGAFGNRGQVDYAAANDALDKLALSLNERLSGRVLSINWGPWGGAGMVSPELATEYARRGVGLIDVDRGVQCFVDELCDGRRFDTQVMFMQAEPSKLQ